MKIEEAAYLYRVTQEMIAITNRDAPLVQVLAFLRVALAGDTGIDQARLADEIDLSNSATSRTVQALSTVHYSKDRPGYCLIDRIFDPTDNRKRELKISAKGRRALEKLAESLRESDRN